MNNFGKKYLLKTKNYLNQILNKRNINEIVGFKWYINIINFDIWKFG